ncbi:hypothetical protein MUN74_15245 [Agromyces endophyticus]|uniref:hypothetical protein n=1 Tax=Agromyces sp. H17E-10 TaxID=2932244 RepID=UPI001FD4475C|nr:hypothetical protein [Agromyces sp. H17E-10]UOQ88610.1 hypothetical protein MUN74_15245 [Agromyces sp. H17E-10]
MSDSTPTPADAADDDTAARDGRLDDELAPEESILEGWLPRATPTDGPAPAP